MLGTHGDVIIDWSPHTTEENSVFVTIRTFAESPGTSPDMQPMNADV